MPSGISVPAPTRQLRPITAWFMTTLRMPTRLPSPTVHPCSITMWPTLTRRPSVSRMPASVCSTQPSCTLEATPMVMRSLSPRTIDPNQTEDWSLSTTLPTTVALAATKALPSSVTRRSPRR